ncbi:MAG TPA: Rap1a/Tai family immunity protein [Stellaceae bacterium]|nr:Rap1a/Tai family immunity protein [Stellaceae bacterium]
MAWRTLSLAALLALQPLAAQAVSPNDFLVTTTADLVDLCSVTASDEMHTAAIHFCHGFVAGTYQFYIAERGGTGTPPMYCLPNPSPTRDQAISMFVAWARSNPQYMSDLPVNSLMRFAVTTWPCKK